MDVCRHMVFAGELPVKRYILSNRKLGKCGRFTFMGRENEIPKPKIIRPDNWSFFISNRLALFMPGALSHGGGYSHYDSSILPALIGNDDCSVIWLLCCCCDDSGTFTITRRSENKCRNPLKDNNNPW